MPRAWCTSELAPFLLHGLLSLGLRLNLSGALTGEYYNYNIFRDPVSGLPYLHLFLWDDQHMVAKSTPVPINSTLLTSTTSYQLFIYADTLAKSALESLHERLNGGH